MLHQTEQNQGLQNGLGKKANLLASKDTQSLNTANTTEPEALYSDSSLAEVFRRKPPSYTPNFDAATKTLALSNEQGQTFSWLQGEAAAQLAPNLPAELSQQELALLHNPKQIVTVGHSIFYSTGTSLSLLSNDPAKTTALQALLPESADTLDIKQSSSLGNCYFLAAINGILNAKDPSLLGKLLGNIDYLPEHKAYTISFPGDPDKNVYTISEDHLNNGETAQRSSHKLVPLLELALYEHTKKTKWGLDWGESWFGKDEKLQLMDGGLSSEAAKLLVEQGKADWLNDGLFKPSLSEQTHHFLNEHPNALLFAVTKKETWGTTPLKVTFINDVTGEKEQKELPQKHALTFVGFDEEQRFTLKDPHNPEGTFHLSEQDWNSLSFVETFVPEGKPALKQEIALTPQEDVSVA
jgi:hypothetical protein